MANKNTGNVGFPVPKSLVRINQAIQVDRINVELKNMQRDVGLSPIPSFFTHSFSPSSMFLPSNRKRVLSAPQVANVSVRPSIVRPIPLPPQSTMFMPVKEKETTESGTSSKTTTQRDGCSIETVILRPEICQMILKKLNYSEVAKAREVCPVFNQVGQSILNAGFRSISDEIAKYLLQLKASLPRRGSLREKHSLSLTADYTDSLQMRFNLLEMVFGRYLQRENCCFFAGSVLDAAVKILVLLKTPSPKCLVSYHLIEEFNDQAFLALEYFKDNIECGWYSPCTVGGNLENDSHMEDDGTDVVIDEQEMYDDVVSLKKKVAKNGRNIRRNQKSVMTTMHSMKKEMRAMRAHSLFVDRMMKRQSKELKQTRHELRQMQRCFQESLIELRDLRKRVTSMTNERDGVLQSTVQ